MTQGWKKQINPANPIFGVPPNTFEIGIDGNVKLNNGASSWDDLRFPAVGQNLDSPAGRIDFNYDDCTVDFQNNTLYPTDRLCMVAQMSHEKRLGSLIELHIHWLQNQNITPNWLLGYRWTNVGENTIVVGSETLIKWNSNKITYSSGAIHQLTEFGNIIKPVTDGLSSTLQIRLFRDTTNITGLFAGADSYVGNAQLLEFDIHYIIDGFGSNEEYIK